MKSILYYTYFKGEPDNRQRGFVVATYVDFSTRVWHEGERGYCAARARALADIDRRTDLLARMAREATTRPGG